MTMMIELDGTGETEPWPPAAVEREEAPVDMAAEAVATVVAEARVGRMVDTPVGRWRMVEVRQGLVEGEAPSPPATDDRDSTEETVGTVHGRPLVDCTIPEELVSVVHGVVGDRPPWPDEMAERANVDETPGRQPPA